MIMSCVSEWLFPQESTIRLFFIGLNFCFLLIWNEYLISKYTGDEKHFLFKQIWYYRTCHSPKQAKSFAVFLISWTECYCLFIFPSLLSIWGMLRNAFPIVRGRPALASPCDLFGSSKTNPSKIWSLLYFFCITSSSLLVSLSTALLHCLDRHNDTQKVTEWYLKDTYILGDAE